MACWLAGLCATPVQPLAQPLRHGSIGDLPAKIGIRNSTKSLGNLQGAYFLPYVFHHHITTWGCLQGFSLPTSPPLVQWPRHDWPGFCRFPYLIHFDSVSYLHRIALHCIASHRAPRISTRHRCNLAVRRADSHHGRLPAVPLPGDCHRLPLRVHTFHFRYLLHQPHCLGHAFVPNREGRAESSTRRSPGAVCRFVENKPES